MAAKEIPAVLEVIRPNGDQGYRVGPGQNDIFWLIGPDQCDDAEIGMKGTLVQGSNGTRSWYEFEPE